MIVDFDRISGILDMSLVEGSQIETKQEFKQMELQYYEIQQNN